MRLAVVEIVPLIGKQHAVLFGLAQFVGEPAPDMLVIVRIGKGQSRHLDQLGAAQPQHVLLFLALRFRDHDQRAIAARIGDQRQPDPGIAGGALDHQAAGLELAALLGLQDHLAAGAVLHRLARIHELGLAENGAAGRRGGALKLDQGRIADGIDNAVLWIHLLGPGINSRANLPGRAGATSRPIGRADCAIGMKRKAILRLTRRGQKPSAGRRYCGSGIRPRNRRGNIPTAAGTVRRIRAG